MYRRNERARQRTEAARLSAAADRAYKRAVDGGIGLATAKRFVDEGAYVFITGRRHAELSAAVNEIGTNLTGVRGDTSNLGDLDRLFGDRYDHYPCTHFADRCPRCGHLDPDYAEGTKLHRCHLPYRDRGYGVERHRSFHPLIP